jgi:catechol 2,3-dioxygenase-like lactoylglutathione lyase family enzyme
LCDFEEILMRLLQGLGIFIVGTLAGMLIAQASAAPKENEAQLNHVGMYVKNMDASLDFYTKTMGFRETYLFKDEQGKPAMAFIQVSRETFIELMPADADHPAGFSHAGFQVDNETATIDTLRHKGVKVEDAHPGLRMKALSTDVLDPDGLRLELLEFTPDSLQRKAIDSWK